MPQRALITAMFYIFALFCFPHFHQVVHVHTQQVFEVRWVIIKICEIHLRYGIETNADVILSAKIHSKRFNRLT